MSKVGHALRGMTGPKPGTRHGAASMPYAGLRIPDPGSRIPDPDLSSVTRWGRGLGRIEGPGRPAIPRTRR
jgi:hypothetical protein